ncbi:hypothetical protein Q1695_002267 [Nippostrongylus brasiliensis]|nr:hypothetical protein Q1695_002267 [Nippostrongylus brasiliensis]
MIGKGFFFLSLLMSCCLCFLQALQLQVKEMHLSDVQAGGDGFAFMPAPYPDARTRMQDQYLTLIQESGYVRLLSLGSIIVDGCCLCAFFTSLLKG